MVRRRFTRNRGRALPTEAQNTGPEDVGASISALPAERGECSRANEEPMEDPDYAVFLDGTDGNFLRAYQSENIYLHAKVDRLEEQNAKLEARVARLQAEKANLEAKLAQQAMLYSEEVLMEKAELAYFCDEHTENDAKGWRDFRSPLEIASHYVNGCKLREAQMAEMDRAGGSGSGTADE